MAMSLFDQETESGNSLPLSENTELLSSALREQVEERHHPSTKTRTRTLRWSVVFASLLVLAILGIAVSTRLFGRVAVAPGSDHVLSRDEDVLQFEDEENSESESVFQSDMNKYPIDLEGKSHHGHKKSHHEDKDDNIETKWYPEPATTRCKWVVNLFTERDAGKTHKELRKQYAVQAADFNVFYRATAHIFWLDFVAGNWSQGCLANIKHPTLYDGTPLEPKSMWTWVTGDQHLSNFGAWHNRHGDLVFSVNDFDEAAIYDFHVDALRIAVSICNHAFANALSAHEIKDALRAFTDTYIETVISYVGGDREILYEITPWTAKGALRQFLVALEIDNSADKQLSKFTEVDSSGARRFSKNNDTRLVALNPELEGKIRDAFTPDNYGATMMKMGWHVHQWDEDYFEVLDVAARVGSGVGSYGVDRYYVLLNGEDRLLQHDGQDGNAVILDIKFEPTPAVSQVLGEEDTAWYNVLFANEAARAVEAQRRLTSYTDPFLGWIIVDGETLLVRQRSPWKESPDLSKLTDPHDFIEFMKQIAVATATSHARGTVGKSPGQFKHVIASIFGKKSNRKKWGKSVQKIAQNYHEQVILDFRCFKDFVDANYS
jgi:uncharacterized protein (DUF2252 family)